MTVDPESGSTSERPRPGDRPGDRRFALDEDPAASLVTVYTPESALRNPVALVRQMFQDIRAGRDLSWRMFVRNLHGLYRQTLLGLFWVFLPPLANTVIWVFLSAQRVVPFADRIPNYTAYVLAGMVIWQSFIEALQAPLNAIQSNRNMLSKLRFPREAILMVAVYEVIFNLCVRAVLLIPILWWFGGQWSGWTLMVPLTAAGLVVLGIAMGCFLMPFGVLYHDVGRLLVVIIPVWMILTQIVYPAPTDWASSPLNWANPPSPLLLLTRDLLVVGHSEYWGSAAVYLVAALPLLGLGLVFYRLSIPVLVERMS